MTRSLILLAILVGCGGRARSPAEPAVEPGGIAFDLDAKAQAKLSPLFATKWRAGHYRAGEYTPVIVQSDRLLGEVDRANLVALGAEHVWFVTTSPGNDGSVFAKASTREAADSLVFQIPGDKLRDVVALDWVTHVEVAGAYPSGPELPADVRRRIDPRLMDEISELGTQRSDSVAGLGKASGCFDAERRGAHDALGARIRSVTADPQCTHTLFTFEIARHNVVAFASLPWIVKLEASRPMYPDSD